MMFDTWSVGPTPLYFSTQLPLSMPIYTHTHKHLFFFHLEMKEAQKKKRQMKERYRQEENIANAMVIWNTEVLPNWESM